MIHYPQKIIGVDFWDKIRRNRTELMKKLRGIHFDRYRSELEVRVCVYICVYVCARACVCP